MLNNMLPLGSVITLDGASKKLMIVGVMLQNEEDHKVYDYLGLPYPEGYVDDETLFLFMEKDIKEVHFVGYMDAETQLFRAEIQKNLEKEHQ